MNDSNVQLSHYIFVESVPIIVILICIFNDIDILFKFA